MTAQTPPTPTVSPTRRVNACAFVSAFSSAGMPAEEKAERNLRLFSETVLPRLHTHDAGGAIDRSDEFAQAAE